MILLTALISVSSISVKSNSVESSPLVSWVASPSDISSAYFANDGRSPPSPSEGIMFDLNCSVACAFAMVFSTDCKLIPVLRNASLLSFNKSLLSSKLCSGLVGTSSA